MPLQCTGTELWNIGDLTRLAITSRLKQTKLNRKQAEWPFYFHQFSVFDIDCTWMCMSNELVFLFASSSRSLHWSNNVSRPKIAGASLKFNAGRQPWNFRGSVLHVSRVRRTGVNWREIRSFRSVKLFTRLYSREIGEFLLNNSVARGAHALPAPFAQTTSRSNLRIDSSSSSLWSTRSPGERFLCSQFFSNFLGWCNGNWEVRQRREKRDLWFVDIYHESKSQFSLYA